MGKARIGQVTQVDDLEVGQFITVLGKKSPEDDVHQFDAGPVAIMTALTGMPSRYDRLKGLPLKIAAKHLPYIVVQCTCGNEECECRPMPIDTREVELTVVGEEYAESMRQKRPRRSWWQRLTGRA